MITSGFRSLPLRRRPPVRDDLLRHAGGLVGLFAHRDARDEIHEARHTALFGDDRQGVGVPFEQLRATLDRLAVLDVHLRAVADLVGRPFLTVLVDDGDLHVPAHHDLLAIGVGQKVRVAELDLAFLAGFEERLLAALRDAADVEGPHRQLRAGFADRLRRDDADRLADVHHRAAGKVTPVAHGADAFLGLAGQRAADAGRLATPACAIASARRSSISSLRLTITSSVPGHKDVLGRDTAQHTLGQRRHDLAVVHRRFRGDRVLGAAVVRPHDAVLRHVDQTAGQVARVRRLERRVRQTLARAVGGVEVLQHGQAFLEVRDDRRLDDLARRLGHQAAHPAQLLHLRRRATRPGVGHHVDRVRLFLGARRRHSGPPRFRPSSRPRPCPSISTRHRRPCCTSHPG